MPPRDGAAPAVALTARLRERADRIGREGLVNVALLAGLALVAIAGQAVSEPFTITLATKIAILAIAGIGLNIALGLGGLISLGHAAFFGAGGYVVAILSSHAQAYEPFLTQPIVIEGTTAMLVLWPLAILIGALAAAAIGALSLRSSGVYFIMITLAFAQMLYYFAISWPAYGGEDGLPFPIRNSLPGLNTLDPLSFFAVCFVLLCAVIWGAGRLAASPFGLALQCARQNDARLASVGLSPFPIRWTAFVISGAITALAGALYADLNRFVSPEMLSWRTSGEIMVLVILGGVGRLCGPLAGAVAFIALEHLLGGLTEYWKALFGLLLVVVVLYAPGGVMQVLAGPKCHD